MVDKTPLYAGIYPQKLPVVDYEPSELATNFRNIAARTLLMQHFFIPTLHHLFQPNGRKNTLDSVLRGKDATTWKRSLSMRSDVWHREMTMVSRQQIL